jgi:hypothetical protein
MGNTRSRLKATLHVGPVKVDGNYSILLRNSESSAKYVPAFSGDTVEVALGSDSESQADISTGTVTFTCGTQNVRVDQIDMGSGANNRTIYLHRLSFLGSNHKFINGDKNLYDRLPPSVAITMYFGTPPLTAWEGSDAEVVGHMYKPGSGFEADSIVIPRMDLVLIRPESAGGADFFMIAIVFAFWTFALIAFLSNFV